MKSAQDRRYNAARSMSFMLFAVVLLQSCSGSSTGPAAARRLVDAAAEKMGGWAVLDSLRTFEIRTRGTDWEPLQTVSPDAEPRQVSTFQQTLRADLRSLGSTSSLLPAASTQLRIR